MYIDTRFYKLYVRVTKFYLKFLIKFYRCFVTHKCNSVKQNSNWAHNLIILNFTDKFCHTRFNACLMYNVLNAHILNHVYTNCNFVPHGRYPQVPISALNLANHTIMEFNNSCIVFSNRGYNPCAQAVGIRNNFN